MDSVKLLSISQSFNQLAEPTKTSFISSPDEPEEKTKTLGNGLKDALAGTEQDWVLLFSRYIYNNFLFYISILMSVFLIGFEFPF